MSLFFVAQDRFVLYLTAQPLIFLIDKQHDTLISRNVIGMIDLDEIEYEDFCKSQDIPNIYKSKQDFIQKYCFSLEDEN